MSEENATPKGTEDKSKHSREDFFKEFLGHLTIPFVKAAAEGFFENIRQVESLVGMPFIIFSFLEVDDHMFKAFRSSAQEHWSRGMDYTTFLESQLTQPPLRIPEMIPDFLERTQKRFDEALGNPTYGPYLTSSMQVVYSAAISGSWTALECLATDLWVASLNEHPLPLAQAALGSLDPQESGELTGKQISVGLAARYGFDLRHSLGTLLRSKFDFTSVAGIQRAYKVFVPADDFVRKIFAEPLLSELEATRHLIVHRAGKVDEEYKKRISSKLDANTFLTFTEAQTSKFARVSQATGFGLLAFVNDWFVGRQKSEPKPTTSAPDAAAVQHLP